MAYLALPGASTVVQRSTGAQIGNLVLRDAVTANDLRRHQEQPSGKWGMETDALLQASSVENGYRPRSYHLRLHKSWRAYGEHGGALLRGLPASRTVRIHRV